MRQYNKLLQRVIDTGELRNTRSGTVRSIFSPGAMVFDTAESFPLVWTKATNFRAVVAELLWFLSGSTNTNDLDSTIWDEWASSSGDLGPIYGAQWRGTHSKHAPDQIKQLVDGLIHHPMSRRHIVNSWVPQYVPSMALPPCHTMFQCYVRGTKPLYTLDLHLYQRSADLGLGVPFNIASYALLLKLLSDHVCMRPGKLYHTIGDAHVYEDHVDALSERLSMPDLPENTRLVMTDIVDPTAIGTGILQHIDDIAVSGYRCYSPIRLKVAI